MKVKIPAGTQSGTTLRLKGKGVKDLRGNGYGDQMVKVEVKIPTKLSSKEKSLYEQLQKLSKKESEEYIKKERRCCMSKKNEVVDGRNSRSLNGRLYERKCLCP